MNDFLIRGIVVAVVIAPVLTWMVADHVKAMRQLRSLDRRMCAVVETMHRVVKERDELRVTLPFAAMTGVQQEEFVKRLAETYRAGGLNVTTKQPIPVRFERAAEHLEVPLGPPCEIPEPRGPYR